MIVQKIEDNIICFFGETQKELTLTFFRVQEFYESRDPFLFRKPFDAYVFLERTLDKHGRINYFSDWDGFNVPGYIFTSWMASTVYQQRSELEESMINNVYKLIDPNKPFYVIGVRQRDKATLKHELSHAFYYLNANFKFEADNILHVLKSTYPEKDKTIRKELKLLGYADNVMDDEMVAWLATSSKDDLAQHNLYHPECENIYKLFRKLLRKYNKYV